MMMNTRIKEGFNRAASFGAANNKVIPAQSTLDPRKVAANLISSEQGLERIQNEMYNTKRTLDKRKSAAMIFEEWALKTNPRNNSLARRIHTENVVSPQKRKEEDAAQLKQFKEKYGEKKKSKFLLNPRSGFFRLWDINTAILLLYTAIVTPFEVGFLKTRLNALFYVNRCVDLCFLTDLFFNFFMPYQQMFRGTTKEVTDIGKIARRYVLRSPYWFFIDLVSILPFDILTVLGTGGTDNLKVVRVVRLLRLAKLARILRAGRMFQRLESSYPVNYSMVSLWKFVIGTMFLAHWLACAWGVILDLQGTAGLDLEFQDGFTPSNWVDYYSFIDMKSSPLSLYLASLYWALATLSTVGYGDVVPVTDYERAYCICCTILGATVYAYTVGAVCSILAAMDINATTFYHAMDSLNDFIRTEQIDSELAIRLRTYFRYKYEQGGNENLNSLLDNLSPVLRQEVAVKLHSKWIHMVPFFESASDEFITAVSSKLVSVHFPSQETIVKLNEMANRLYILRKGIVVCKGLVLTQGKALGTDIIYHNYQRPYTAVSFTNSTLLVLEKVDLQETLQYFPVTAHKLRLEASRMMFRDTVLAYVRAVKLTLTESNGEAGTGRVVDKYFSTDMLPLVYKHRLQLILQENPEEIDRLAKATLTLQKHAREGLRRRRYRLMLEKNKSLPRRQLAGMRLLVKNQLASYIEVFKAQEILDPKDMAELTADAISRTTEMPLGSALRMIRSAQSYIIARNEQLVKQTLESLEVTGTVKIADVGP